MSNHYQTLGVPHDASHELILAAYRALAKAFHPDTFKADRNFAEEKLKEINNAFEVVGAPDLRGLYDQSLNKEKGSKSSKSNRTNHDRSHEESWLRTCDFFPFLKKLDADLSSISPELSRKFRSETLSKRAFGEASNISQRLIHEFALVKFGSSQDLRAAGLTAMRLGYRSFALEINKACLLVGDQNADAILRRLAVDHSDEAIKIYSSCGLDRFVPEVLREEESSPQVAAGRCMGCTGSGIRLVLGFFLISRLRYFLKMDFISKNISISRA